MIKQSEQHSKELLIKEVGFDEYFTGHQWAEYNRKFFNNLAPKYDYLNEVITMGMQKRYKTKIIKCSPIKDGDLVLDICTGSGDMALLMGKMLPNSHIVAVDVAEKMLEIAKEKAKGMSNVEFRYADAMRLPYDDQTFDASIMSYGLRNLADFRKGILEMKRVTKPGGAVIIVDLGKPSGMLNKVIYKVYFETIMPLLGRHIFHRGEFNSFNYLPKSNKFFPSPRGLREIMFQCGLKKVETYTHMMGIVSQQIGLV